MTKADAARTRLRAWWFRRQGLSRRGAPASLAACFRQAGWFVTAGSTGVYLSIRARLPGTTRETVDRAALDGKEVVEVPGAHARPPVLVPRDEMALALRSHRASYAKHAAPVFASGRYSEAALRAIAAQASRALDEGPLSTAEIRERVTHPDAAELLTGALIDLAVSGVIRRYPADGRLDSSKYIYELRHADDRPDLEAPGDTAAIERETTRLFLRRHGPATVDEIAEWSTLTKSAVRGALAVLGAEQVAVAGWTENAWLLADDLRDWNAFDADDRQVVFLPFRDPFVAARRPAAVLARGDNVQVLNAKLQIVCIGEVETLKHHTVVAGGELVGVWEYDPDHERIVTRLWNTDKTLGAAVREAAAETEHFIQQQLGDAKLSSVDPPAQRARRIAFCAE